MAEANSMTAEEVVRRFLDEGGVDFVRESVRWMVEQLMETEVSELIGAARGERTPDRATHRNGYRSRRWDTRAGEIELQIPKLRQRSYFPSFLTPRASGRAGARGGGAGGVCRRRLDEEGRPAGREPGAADLEVGGLADLPGARRAGRGVPPETARRPLPVPVPRREGREGPRRRPGRARAW